jgi:phospholipid/cholesterol/gamma-HCH transport system substrate-binding protein
MSRTFNLARQWERIRTVPGLGRDVGALAALVVVGLVAAVGIQANLATSGLFESRTVLKAEFASVPGVNPDSSNRVTIAGVAVGYVSAAQTTDHGTALLTLNVEGNQKIFDNARAVLRPKNPLNEMSVELSPGGPPGQPLPTDGIIPVAQTSRPIQADEVLQHLDARTQTAMTALLSESDTALARAPEELPAGLGATTDTLVALQPVATALQTRRAKIAELVTALSRIAAGVGKNDQRVAQLVDATQTTLGVLSRNQGALRDSVDQLPGLSDQLRSALTSTQRLTQQLDPTLDDLHRASDALPPALDRFTGTVKQLGSTVDAAAPFVAKARPVVADLRPLVADSDTALDDLLPVTGKLDSDTATVTAYLTEIRAFVYNTRSVFGAGDSLGSVIRGHLVIPSGALVIPQQPGYAPGPENGQVGAAQNPTAPKPPSGTALPLPLLGGN